MGKQKDFRRIRHPSHKKKDKQFDKTAKATRNSCQENYMKYVENVVQQELESAATAKKIRRNVRKELVSLTTAVLLIKKNQNLFCFFFSEKLLYVDVNISSKIFFLEYCTFDFLIYLTQT